MSQLFLWRTVAVVGAFALALSTPASAPLTGEDKEKPEEPEEPEGGFGLFVSNLKKKAQEKMAERNAERNGEKVEK